MPVTMFWLIGLFRLIMFLSDGILVKSLRWDGGSSGSQKMWQ